MSTKIKCTTGTDVTFRFDDADPYRSVEEFYIAVDEEDHYVLRADFLAAVETECGVRIVPDDAIVIERAELPEVTEIGTSQGIHGPVARVRADGRDGYADTPSADYRRAALASLALAEYLAAHPPVPPVDEAQVRAVNDVLASYVARWRRNDLDLARQLVAWGVRVDLP